MADKPSRALVLYGDGSARFLHPSQTHLHSLASKSSCGFLGLPNAPSSDFAESEDERIVRESAILLDAYEAYLNSNKNTTSTNDEFQNQSLIPTISQRFMGMKAAMVTTNSRLVSFGTKLGFTVLQSKYFTENVESSILASELLKLLGFQEGKTLETSRFDLVFVHIRAGEKKDKAVANDMDFISSLVGEIMKLAEPGSEVGSRLHFSVVLSYGSVSKDDDCSKTSVLVTKDEKNVNLSSLFPRQSYTMRGENQRTDVRHYCPMLIAQWQHAVTRKDSAQTFSFEEFKEHGGSLVIPADRFLHEVAFKLWKAPKYGA